LYRIGSFSPMRLMPILAEHGTQIRLRPGLEEPFNLTPQPAASTLRPQEASANAFA
jgi:hypothetical protein